MFHDMVWVETRRVLLPGNSFSLAVTSNEILSHLFNVNKIDVDHIEYSNARSDTNVKGVTSCFHYNDLIL